MTQIGQEPPRRFPTTVRLTREERKALEFVQALRGDETMSETLRVALNDLIARYLPDWPGRAPAPAMQEAS